MVLGQMSMCRKGPIKKVRIVSSRATGAAAAAGGDGSLKNAPEKQGGDSLHPQIHLAQDPDFPPYLLECWSKSWILLHECQ